jgi:hypothetical protein
MPKGNAQFNFYDNLMKEPPHAIKRHSGKRKFRYMYADVECAACLNTAICIFEICPYIMDNLTDLELDRDFQQAVINADSCTTKHKNTLLFVREQLGILD